MEKGDDPNQDERKQNRRTETEDAVKIFSERHRGERNRRGEADRGGNETGHEADRGMINLGKKMIFAAGARKCGTQFAVTKRAAQRGDSADDPKHQQRETGLNVRDLKPEAGKNAGADNIRDHNPTGGEKADAPSRRLRSEISRPDGFVHD